MLLERLAGQRRAGGGVEQCLDQRDRAGAGHQHAGHGPASLGRQQYDLRDRVGRHGSARFAAWDAANATPASVR